jgi:uncharacterized membrane protein YjjP (DUF1212 family)
MKSEEKIKSLMLLLIYTGRLMLKSGAETYRVEDTMKRMAMSRNIEQFDSFVTPTGLFISASYKNDSFSYIRRIKKLSIDLQKVSEINEFSRLFVSSNMSIKDGFKTIKKIETGLYYPKYLQRIGGGLGSAGFAILFGGNYIDFFPAFCAGFILLTFSHLTQKNNISILVNNILGGMVVTIITLIFHFLYSDFNIAAIISGSIMPLAPGVAITNAIRDFIYGDYLAGVSRAIEAIIIAIGIAFGVGIILNLSQFIGGLIQ